MKRYPLLGLLLLSKIALAQGRRLIPDRDLYGRREPVNGLIYVGTENGAVLAVEVPY